MWTVLPLSCSPFVLSLFFPPRSDSAAQLEQKATEAQEVGNLPEEVEALATELARNPNRKLWD